MRYTQFQTKHLMLLVGLLLVSACATGVTLPPPAADLQAVVEPQPVPTDAILTSAQANADYNAEVESWGTRLYFAGGRLCRWSVKVYKIKHLTCPKEDIPKEPSR